MSQGIGHFAAGVSGGFLILLTNPRMIPNFIKNDIFFVGLMGFWAMLPDVIQFVDSDILVSLHNSVWANVFWFHRFLDLTDPGDTTLFSVGLLAIALFMGYLYFRKVQK